MYEFKNIKNNILEYIKEIILYSSNNDIQHFINSYYNYYYLYYNSINHYFYNNKDIPKELIDIHNSINIDYNIIKFLLSNINNREIKYIIKNICSYIEFQKIINKNIINKYIKFIKSNISINEIMDDKERIINIVFYRKISTMQYKNFDEFYSKKIYKSKNTINLKLIPQSTNIIDLCCKNNNCSNVIFNINEIIQFIIGDYKNVNVEYNNNNINILFNKLHIIHIIKSIRNDVVVNNINTEKINYLPQNNYCETTIFYTELNNLSTLLIFIHNFLYCIKLSHSKPTNLYEFDNPLKYNEYYYDSFVYFISYIKPHINKNMIYNKFLVELFRFYYLYSFVDYIFYYDNAMDYILENPELKHRPFNELFNNLTPLFHLSSDLLNYPPFIKNSQTSINDITNYCIEQPNYYKLFDFINALLFVFNKPFKNNTLDTLFCSCVKIDTPVTVIKKNIPIINDNDDNYYTEIIDTIQINKFKDYF